MTTITAAFRLTPLMRANALCTMALMAFLSLLGPINRMVDLAAWQIGTVITVGGVLWMLLSRIWGLASDNGKVCQNKNTQKHKLVPRS